VVPEGLDLAVACVVARHFPLACAMVRGAAVRDDETVLVMGAGGGLGSALVQVLRDSGARIIAAAGDDRRLDAAGELGAHDRVNYRREPLAARLDEMTSGRGVDVVFENISDPTLFPDALSAMARHGRLLTVGAHGGGTVPLDIARLYEWRLQVRSGLAPLRPDDLENSLRRAQSGDFRALIDTVLPLADAPRAHELAERRDGVGKIVIDPTR
jgi:NADPH:quinone reductase-like Zn-dependent oxidoreductase